MGRICPAKVPGNFAEAMRVDGGYRFIGQGPLRTFDKWHIAVSLGLIALMFFNP